MFAHPVVPQGACNENKYKSTVSFPRTSHSVTRLAVLCKASPRWVIAPDTTPDSETVMAGAQVSSVLAGWPAPWRVAAVLTGVLPVRGALHSRPPYQYRLCSGPVLAGVVVATIFTVYGTSWLMPQTLALHKINNTLLAVVFELTITLPWCGSSWLLVVRGRQIPDMLSKAEEVLMSNGISRAQRPFKQCLIHFMLVLSPVFLAGSALWSLYSSGNALHLGNNSLLYLFNNINGITSALFKMTLLSLSVHMMQMFSGVFEAISGDLERELHSTSTSCSCQSATTSYVGHPKRDYDRAMTPVEVVCRPSDSVSVSQWLPSPPSSQADILAGLRERYLAAADATASFSAVYVLPALCLLVHEVALAIAHWTSLSILESPMVLVWAGFELAVFAVLLCLHGQWLEEAARRPLLLLLRRPPRHPEAAAEATRLMALVEALRPGAAAAGSFNINSRLLVSVVVGVCVCVCKRSGVTSFVVNTPTK